MRKENQFVTHTLIGRAINSPLMIEPTYKVKRETLKCTCKDPQIWEMECEDRTLLYARFNNGELTCKEKNTGVFICSGNPVLHKDKIPDEKVEFYLEMYSKHTINFQ
jgi:hypothetical protein